MLQEMYQDRSVTELEIIQAAFLEDGEFCRFYFRQPDHVDELFKDLPEDVRAEKLQIYEPESEYSNLKVRDLKARIVKKGLAVEYFRTPEELAFQVFENWKAIVDKLYPPLLDVITVLGKSSLYIDLCLICLKADLLNANRCRICGLLIHWGRVIHGEH